MHLLALGQLASDNNASLYMNYEYRNKKNTDMLIILFFKW